MNVNRGKITREIESNLRQFSELINFTLLGAIGNFLQFITQRIVYGIRDDATLFAESTYFHLPFYSTNTIDRCFLP